MHPCSEWFWDGSVAGSGPQDGGRAGTARRRLRWPVQAQVVPSPGGEW